jgi:hypothetical protein
MPANIHSAYQQQATAGDVQDIAKVPDLRWPRHVRFTPESHQTRGALGDAMGHELPPPSLVGVTGLAPIAAAPAHGWGGG